MKDLTDCISQAVKAGASCKLDGSTSDEGPLTADGTPAIDSPENRKLSQQRIDTIARLLADKFDGHPTAITSKVAHGNTDQPYPADPEGRRTGLEGHGRDPPPGQQDEPGHRIDPLYRIRNALRAGVERLFPAPAGPDRSRPASRPPTTCRR